MHCNFTIKSSFRDKINYWTWGDFQNQFWLRGYSYSKNQMQCLRLFNYRLLLITFGKNIGEHTHQLPCDVFILECIWYFNSCNTKAINLWFAFSSYNHSPIDVIPLSSGETTISFNTIFVYLVQSQFLKNVSHQSTVDKIIYIPWNQDACSRPKHNWIPDALKIYKAIIMISLHSNIR